MLKITQRFFSSTCRASQQQQQQPLMIRNSRIAASVILSRAPQITRDATPFEQAYFDYKEKNERHSSAVFPQDFYFKKGSVAERRWKEDVQARDAAMKDASVSLTEAVQQRQDNANTITTTTGTPIQILDRTTQSDKDNDIKKLDRALQRNLYLIVKQHNQWQFPQSDLQANEYLHEAAERHLRESCGKDMDVWFVGRQPVTFYKKSPSRKEDTDGLKVFFVKARIYAGQVKPNKDVSDFAWVTKDEMTTYLSPDYYMAIKDSLADL